MEEQAEWMGSFKEEDYGLSQVVPSPVVGGQEYRKSFLPSQTRMKSESHRQPEPTLPRWNAGKILVYMIIGFALYLLSYIAVQYAKDVRQREERNHKRNLKSHVEHSMALAGRVPRGYQSRQCTVEEVEEDDDGSAEEEEG